MGDNHRVRVEIEDGGIHFRVLCPYEITDRMRPCKPDIFAATYEPVKDGEK